MARQSKGQGVSWLKKDAQQVGLFQGGQCELSFIFGMYDYRARGKHPALIVSLKDENGEVHEEPYGVGKGWAVSPDGTELIPRQGQTGLPVSCDTIKYLVGPLEQAVEAFGAELPASTDITALDGIVALVERKPVEARDFKDDRRQSKEEAEKAASKTKLVITEIVSLPWDEDKASAKGKGKAKAKAQVEDDDDEEEEVAAPAKGKKAKAAKADDEGEVDAEAMEHLIELLEDEDGPIAVDGLEAALLTALKGNPARKAIAARAADVDFLDLQDGWKFNKKKGVVTLA